jgi:hypothetical protein
MRRLYRQVYLTIIASLLLMAAFGGMFWWFAPRHWPGQQGLELVGELVAPLLPPADADNATHRQALDRIHGRFRIDLALFDRNLRLMAAVGRPLPPPPQSETAGWVIGPGGPAWAIRLPDERWLVARTLRRGWHPVLRLIGFLGAIALAAAVCAYPLVRRLTRRLERLQTGVEQRAGRPLRARQGGG